MERNPFGKAVLRCPVGKEELGYLADGEVCSFVCKDCSFIYTWDRKGKLKPPQKLDLRVPKICTCEGCKTRDK